MRHLRPVLQVLEVFAEAREIPMPEGSHVLVPVVFAQNQAEGELEGTLHARTQCVPFVLNKVSFLSLVLTFHRFTLSDSTCLRLEPFNKWLIFRDPLHVCDMWQELQVLAISEQTRAL